MDLEGIRNIDRDRYPGARLDGGRMIYEPGDNEFIDTIIAATVAGVCGSFQVGWLIVKTSKVEGLLLIKMTDTRTALRLHQKRDLSSFHIEPAFKMRSSLINMSEKLDELFLQRRSSNEVQ